MKWLREVDGEASLVSNKNGGGPRFVTIKKGEDGRFASIKERALGFYFNGIDDTNTYNEGRYEVNSSMVDATMKRMDDDDKIGEYLARNGLFSSRVYFYLLTCPPSDGEDLMFHAITTPEGSQNSSPLNSPIKRKLCEVCSHTYTGNVCLVCEQNYALKLSLEKDQRARSPFTL